MVRSVYKGTSIFWVLWVASISMCVSGQAIDPRELQVAQYMVTQGLSLDDMGGLCQDALSEGGGSFLKFEVEELLSGLTCQEFLAQKIVPLVSLLQE